jgi:hypothetical protein
MQAYTSRTLPYANLPRHNITLYQLTLAEHKLMPAYTSRTLANAKPTLAEQ